MPIVSAFATSHAYTFQEPETWDQRRERSKRNVERKAGRPASDTAEARAETLEDNRARYAHIRDAHRAIRERLAVQGVVAGEAGLTIASPAAVLGFVRDGRLRALAIGAQGRSPLLPEVPTLAEAGGDDDTLVPTYFAFALPAGTPRPIVDRLHQAMRGALATPELAQRLGAAGLEPAGGTGEALLELVRRDIPRFRRIIQDIGIQPE